MHNYVDLGIAVDLDFEGLLVPVVRDADDKRLRAIAREINDLATPGPDRRSCRPTRSAAARSRSRTTAPPARVLTLPIINQPQVAILSTDGDQAPAGRGRPAPTAARRIAIHSVGNLAMSWDHRAFDGAYAAALPA